MPRELSVLCGAAAPPRCGNTFAQYIASLIVDCRIKNLPGVVNRDTLGELMPPVSSPSCPKNLEGLAQDGLESVSTRTVTTKCTPE